jgi:penicillin-binding protein 2
VNQDSPRLRLSVLGVVVFALFASLFARLWYLQVMATDEYQVTAQANRIRTVPVEAPRGRILDRNGRVLVDNRISVQVTIDRTILADLDEDERLRVLTALADGLARSGRPTTVKDLEERIADQRYSPYVPVPVAGDVPEELKIWIDEHSDELPSVAADRVAVRRYPYGSLAAHVLGYTGKITKEELDGKGGTSKPYTLNDEIGKAGIERVYEDDLRGTPGITQLEVDTDGNTIRVIPEGTTAPVPGDDVVLNLDIDLQATAEQALQTPTPVACWPWRRSPPSRRPSSSTASARTSGHCSVTPPTTSRSTTGRCRASTRPAPPSSRSPPGPRCRPVSWRRRPR